MSKLVTLALFALVCVQSAAAQSHQEAEHGVEVRGRVAKPMFFKKIFRKIKKVAKKIFGGAVRLVQKIVPAPVLGAIRGLAQKFIPAPIMNGIQRLASGLMGGGSAMSFGGGATGSSQPGSGFTTGGLGTNGGGGSTGGGGQPLQAQLNAAAQKTGGPAQKPATGGPAQKPATGGPAQKPRTGGPAQGRAPPPPPVAAPSQAAPPPVPVLAPLPPVTGTSSGTGQPSKPGNPAKWTGSAIDHKTLASTKVSGIKGGTGSAAGGFTMKGRYGDLKVQESGSWEYNLDESNALVKAYGTRPNALFDVFTLEFSGMPPAKTEIRIHVWEHFRP